MVGESARHNKSARYNELEASGSATSGDKYEAILVRSELHAIMELGNAERPRNENGFRPIEQYLDLSYDTSMRIVYPEYYANGLCREVSVR